MTGDAAVVAADGYVRILGRIDDVINVSGHRLGTKELESAAMTVAESAKSLTGPPGELATNTVLCGGRSGAGFFPGDPEESVFAVSGMTS
jgi:acyl-coenzyme A synthetase/AMP-(fatty) acid ligase